VIACEFNSFRQQILCRYFKQKQVCSESGWALRFVYNLGILHGNIGKWKAFDERSSVFQQLIPG